MEHFCKHCNKSHLRQEVGEYKNGQRKRKKYVDETGRAWISENQCSKSLRDFQVKNKVCFVCFNEFTTNKKHKAYCSKECQKKAAIGKRTKSDQLDQSHI